MTTTVDQALPSFPEPNQMGGWSFLQALTTPDNGDDVVYVHPLVKRSRSPLTEKGLEMCTESLGSETGSDTASFDFPVSFPEPGPSVRAKARVREETATVRRELPPPLPSISGVHVECVREGGRLVMRAVTVGPAHACFEAQRDNGRLTLRFTESCATGCESYEEEEEEDCEGKDTDGIYEEVEGNTYATASTSSRCNEEESTNRDMLYAEAFWVSTS